MLDVHGDSLLPAVAKSRYCGLYLLICQVMLPYEEPGFRQRHLALVATLSIHAGDQILRSDGSRKKSESLAWPRRIDRSRSLALQRFWERLPDAFQRPRPPYFRVNTVGFLGGALGSLGEILCRLFKAPEIEACMTAPVVGHERIGTQRQGFDEACSSLLETAESEFDIATAHP